MNYISTSHYSIRLMATSLVLTNALCAVFAIVALGDVQYSRATSVASAQPAQPTQPTPLRLTFRTQKPGTQTQLLHAQQQRQTLGSTIAPHTNATAIARLDQHITTFYEPAALDAADIAGAWVNPGTTADITIQFTATGKQKLAQLTQRLAGSDRTLGIFLNDTLIVAPIVAQSYAATGITTGTVQIVGNFTQQQASDIVRQILAQR